jgi:hypothetical protein
MTIATNAVLDEKYWKYALTHYIVSTSESYILRNRHVNCNVGYLRLL